MIKILLLEDSHDKTISLKLALQKTSLEFQLVSGLHNLDSIELINNETPDFIFMDLELSSKNDFVLCQGIKKDDQLKDIPIAFLSTEDDAIKKRVLAIENGANAFINLPINDLELNTQIQLLLKQKTKTQKNNDRKFTEEKLRIKAEEEIEILQENVKGLKNIFDCMSEGFSIQDVICDDEGHPIDLRFMEANPAFEKQTGLINSKTLGHTLLGLFPTSETYWIERYGNVGITGEPTSFEAMFGPLNIYYHVNAFQTGPRQFGVLFTDINERKQYEAELTKAKERAEESEENLKRGQQIAQMGFWKLQIESMEVTGSPELLKIFEIKEEFNLESFMKMVHPDDKEMDLFHIQQGIEHGKTWDIEHRLLFEDGSVKWIHAIGEPQKDESNSVTHIIGTVQDITERKIAEDLIIKNKNRLNFSLESIEIGAWELDIEKKSSWRSFKHDQIFGYDHPLDEWTYNMFLEHVIPEHKEEVNHKFQYALSTKTDWDFECKIQKNGGDIRWIWAKGVLEFSEQHKLGKMFGIVQDITDRKQAFEKVQESEEKFKSLMHQSPFVVELYDLTGLQISVNKSYEELWGFPAETTVNSFNVLKSQEVVDSGLIEYINRAYAGEAVDVPEFRFDPSGETEAKGEGRERWLSTRIYPIKNQINDVQNIVIVHQDVTDRKQSEENLTQSLIREKLMADIVRESSVGIAIGYPDGALGMCNSAFQKITGYNEEELKSIDWNTVLTPEEWHKVEGIKLEELHRTKKSVQYEKEYIRKDGSKIPIQLLVHPQFDEDDKIIHYKGFIIDITERKLAETKLKDSQNSLSAVFNNTQDAQLLSKYIGDETFIIDAVNASYIKKLNRFGLNITDKDLIGKSLKNLIFEMLKLSEEVYNYTINFYMEVINSQNQIHHDEAFVINDKNYHSETSYSPIYNSENGMTYVLYNSHDITNEKESIELVKKSEERYKILFNNSPVPLWEEDFTEISDYFTTLKEKGIKDLNEFLDNNPEELINCIKMVKIVDVNQATLDLHKAENKEQLIGNLDKTFTDKSLLIFEQELIMLFEGSNNYESEAEVKTLTGELLHIYITLKIDKVQDGKLRGLLATSNITERKIAEIQSKESESNLTALINNTDDSIWSLDKDFNYLIFNSTYAEIFKVSHGSELKKGMNIKPQLSEDEYKFWVPLFEAALNGEKNIFEFSHHFDGVKHHFQTSLNPIYEGKKITGVSARSVNISERKVSEEKITLQLDELSRWHNAMINREEKTLELKKDINDLLKKLGEPIRYSSVEK